MNVLVIIIMLREVTHHHVVFVRLRVVGKIVVPNSASLVERDVHYALAVLVVNFVWIAIIFFRLVEEHALVNAFLGRGKTVPLYRKNVLPAQQIVKLAQKQNALFVMMDFTRVQQKTATDVQLDVQHV